MWTKGDRSGVSIDTLDQHSIDISIYNSVDISINPRSTHDPIDSWVISWSPDEWHKCINWHLMACLHKLANSWPTVDWDVDWVLTKYWPRCWSSVNRVLSKWQLSCRSSVDPGYWSTLAFNHEYGAFSTHDPFLPHICEFSTHKIMKVKNGRSSQ